MDISRLKSNNNLEAEALRIGGQSFEANKAATATKPEDAAAAVEVPADAVSLDALEGVTKIVKQAQDMRLDLVAAMREMIANGDEPSSADIADALLNSGFAEYFIEE
jgi:anti-sigma28 factor (negative regulator of flagellin synthesis)